jgi:hypothetical protein
MGRGNSITSIWRCNGPAQSVAEPAIAVPPMPAAAGKFNSPLFSFIVLKN